MPVWDLVVPLDFGQFYLTGNAAGLEAGFDPMPTLNRALEGDGIARTEGFLVVLSPHQHNPAMRLRIEVHESQPPDDLDDWEEAFEAWLPVDESGVRYESPTVLTGPRVPVPPGEYRVLITGRGFVARGWTPTKPDDEWRIRLWPASGPTAPHRVKAWQQPTASPAVHPRGKPAATETAPPSPATTTPKGIRPFHPPQHIIDALWEGRDPPR
jgi:hypothetical protein